LTLFRIAIVAATSNRTAEIGRFRLTFARCSIAAAARQPTECVDNPRQHQQTNDPCQTIRFGSEPTELECLADGLLTRVTDDATDDKSRRGLATNA
jgi:hypothetical protein